MAVSGGKILSNFLWRFFERLGADGVRLIVGIVLSRILDPTNYATVAMAMSVITIMNVLVDSGMGSALVQKKDADDLDFSSVFYFNLFSCFCLYALIFVGAPWVADFYNNQELVAVIRVLGISVILLGIKNVQYAFVSRNLQFKRFFYATLGGTIAAAVLGITMAYSGYGVWALVAQQLLNSAMDTLILWFTVKWRPKWCFSFERLKTLFSFGWKIMVSGIIDRCYGELRTFIIGKLYKPADLAFYNKGYQYPNMLVSNINSALNGVLFPVMSKAQDSPERVRSMTRKAIQCATYLIMPMMVGLAVCAEPLISIVLTDKWLPAVPYLRLACFSFAFYPIHTANLNAIKAMGRSDIFLRLEIIKKVVGIAILLPVVQYGVMAIAWSALVNSIVCQIINTWPNKKLLNYHYLAQLKDIMPQMLLSLLMGLIVYCVTFLNLSSWLILVIQIPLGIAVYWLGSIIFKLESYGYALVVVNKILDKYNKKHSSKSSS